MTTYIQKGPQFQKGDLIVAWPGAIKIGDNRPNPRIWLVLDHPYNLDKWVCSLGFSQEENLNYIYVAHSPSIEGLLMANLDWCKELSCVRSGEVIYQIKDYDGDSLEIVVDKLPRK